MNRRHYQIGDLTLEPNRELLSGRDALSLNRKALAILSVLAEAEGSLVTKRELMDAVWPECIVEENTIQVHISAIRGALNGEAWRLLTVHGIGYKLKTDDDFMLGGDTGTSPLAVAVLPFINLTGETDFERLGDGIAEELINQLTQVPGLQVPARTSCFAYKGMEMDARQIARELGVATILEGSIRKSEDIIRITAQLAEAGDGFHLWSENYDRKMGNLLDMEDDVAHSIVEIVAEVLALNQAQLLQTSLNTPTRPVQIRISPV